MLPKTLISLIEQGIIEIITISRPSSNDAWSVSASGKTMPGDVANRIELTLEGSTRSWADLDAAYGFIRKSGFPHTVLIEG